MRISVQASPRVRGRGYHDGCRQAQSFCLPSIARASLQVCNGALACGELFCLSVECNWQAGRLIGRQAGRQAWHVLVAVACSLRA